MQFIRLPICRIIDDVRPNCFQFPFIANHAVIKISLPQSFIKRLPALFMHTINIIVGAERFESTYHIAQDERPFLFRQARFPNNKDGMNMIWHQSKHIQINIWESLCQSKPARSHHNACQRRNQDAVVHFPQAALPVINTNGHKIRPGLAVIVSF